MGLMPGQQIYLTGFMATGKSKIGPILARKLNRIFVDTDELIVEAAGKSIPEIFEEDGEAAFRRIESECVVQASLMEPAVIALGGGAITLDVNWETIRATGLCVCLRASAETIYERVTRTEGERPLMAGMTGDERMAKIGAMLEEREPFYGQADVFVESREEVTPEETAEEVVAELKRTEKG